MLILIMMVGIVTTEPEHQIIAPSTIISAPKKLLALQMVISVAQILTSGQWMKPALGVRRTGQSMETVASVAADVEVETVAEQGHHQWFAIPEKQGQSLAPVPADCPSVRLKLFHFPCSGAMPT